MIQVVLATAVVLSPVQTAVTWQRIYMPHKDAQLKKDKLDGGTRNIKLEKAEDKKTDGNLGVDGRLALNGFLGRWRVRMLITVT